MSTFNRRQLLKSVALSAGSAGIFPGLIAPLAAAESDPKKDPNAAPIIDPYADAKFVDGAPPLPAKDNFTVVVLPDTQLYSYSRRYAKNFHAQTEWIVANLKDRRIAAVMHLGDITHKSTIPEWQVAQAAMSRLDGHVPYFIVPGNHDYSDGKELCVDRTTRFNEYFPLKKYENLPTFGGTYDKEPERFENSFHTFSAGACEFLVLALEYGPRKDVVRWANNVVARHPSRQAILVTHAYLYHDNTRYNWKKYGTEQKWSPHDSGIAESSQHDVQDGEELWNNLVNKHENFRLTLNGHVLYDGLGRLVSQNAGGQNVHQLLVNFQKRPNGGDGWLRLLEYSADGQTVDVIDYSPTRNQCNVSDQNHFSLKYV